MLKYINYRALLCSCHVLYKNNNDSSINRTVLMCKNINERVNSMIDTKTITINNILHCMLYGFDVVQSNLIYYCCIQHDDIDVIQFLETCGCDIHRIDDHGYNTLYYATMHNRILVMRYLLDRNVAVELDTKHSLLWYAKNAPPSIYIDIMHRTNKASLCKYKESPLHATVASPLLAVKTGMLLKYYGSDIVNQPSTDSYTTPIHIALSVPYNSDNINLLLNAGANIKHVDKFLNSPVHYLCMTSNIDNWRECKHMITKDLYTRVNIFGDTPLELALQNNYHTYLDMCGELIK